MNLILHLEKLSNVKHQNQLISLKTKKIEVRLETEGPTERKQGQIGITGFTIWTKLKTIQNPLKIIVNDSDYSLK